MFASSGGNIEIVKLFIINGLNINIDRDIDRDIVKLLKSIDKILKN